MNTDGFFAAIISEKLASLHELGTVYTLEDAYDLYEIVVTNRYNEWLASEYARTKRE